MNKCDPVGLKLAYGDVATCVSITERSCTAGQAISGTAGLNDPAGCLSAQTASCDAYFETAAHPPVACLNKPGKVADGAACGYLTQCVDGDYCDLSTATFPDPACMQGTCTGGLQPAGGSCMLGPDDGDLDCDQTTAIHCVEGITANSSPPAGDGNYLCEAVTYGGSGATCLGDSNHQCLTGFNCVAGKCAPVLALNAVCDPTTNNNCDPRIHLSCLAVPKSSPVSYACTAPTVVPLGSQCGVVNGVDQICEGNLYCNTANPTVCAARVAKGGGCVTIATGDNCAYGLTCQAGTCQTPPAPTCN